MEKAQSLTLSDTVNLLEGEEGDHVLGCELECDIDRRRLQEESDVKAQIAMVRGAERRAMFTVTRTEKQIGSMAFEDTERDIVLDIKHQELLDLCRLWRGEICARIDRAVQNVTETMSPKPEKPKGLFNFGEQKKWREEKRQWEEKLNTRLFARNILLDLEAELSYKNLEAEGFIFAHMIYVHAGYEHFTFEQLWQKVVAEHIALVQKIHHIETILKIDHPEDPEYLRSPRVMEFVHRVAREALNVETVDEVSAMRRM